MVMTEIDKNGKISLDRVLYAPFKNRAIYLTYDSTKNEICVVDIDGLFKLKQDLESSHKKVSASDPDYLKVMAQFVSSICYLGVQKTNSISIPATLRNEARMGSGDILEARVIEGVGIALRKMNLSLLI